MGKSKPRRHRSNRQTTGVPVEKVDENQPEKGLQPSEPVSEAIRSLVEKLQSTSPSERECACSTIAAIIAQPRAVVQLVQAGAVRVLGPLMLDDSEDVRQNAVGALRNMSVEGNHEVCASMVKQDVMTPLVALIQKYGVWTPESKTESKLNMEPRVMVFLQAVHLLWNLCENSDVAFSIVNQQNLLPLLVPCLKVQVYGHQVALATAQCLYTVTDNNDQASKQLAATDCVTLLQQIINTQHNNTQELLFKTLATGILYNLSSSGQLDAAVMDVLNSTVQLLVEVLSQDISTGLNIAAQLLAQVKASQTENQETAPTEGEIEIKHKVIEEKMEELLHLISAQRIALEMVANMCVQDDDDEDGEWEDVDSSSGEEMMEAEEGQDGAGDSAPMSPLSVPLEVYGAFVKHNLVQQVFSKVNLPEKQTLADFDTKKTGLQIVKSVSELQSRALVCVNNLVEALEVDALGGATTLHQLWVALGKLAVSQAGGSDPEVLEAVTSAMRAVVQKLGQLKALQLSEITLEDMQFIFGLGQDNPVAEVRANAIRIVATIGCAQVNNNGSNQQVLKIIGEFLLTVCAKEAELWVIAEALDAIFDVFADDETDPVTKDLGLVEKLKTMSQPLKTKIHQQKKSLGEHVPILSTARTNLIRFIKYKAQRLGT